jgi:hypothetical protein
VGQTIEAEKHGRTGRLEQISDFLYREMSPIFGLPIGIVMPRLARARSPAQTDFAAYNTWAARERGSAAFSHHQQFRWRRSCHLGFI